MDFTLKVVRGSEIHRVPLEIEQPPDFELVDLAVRRIWPDVGAQSSWYTSRNGGIYVLEKPIFADFLATAKETGSGCYVLRLELPATSAPSPTIVRGCTVAEPIQGDGFVEGGQREAPELPLGMYKTSGGAVGEFLTMGSQLVFRSHSKSSWVSPVHFSHNTAADEEVYLLPEHPFNKQLAMAFVHSRGSTHVKECPVVEVPTALNALTAVWWTFAGQSAQPSPASGPCRSRTESNVSDLATCRSRTESNVSDLATAASPTSGPASPTAAVPAMAVPSAFFDGVWDTSLTVGRGVICRDKFTEMSGRVTQLHMKTPRVLEMTYNDITHIGELTDDGKLHWSDGDVWIRRQEVESPLLAAAPVRTCALGHALAALGTSRDNGWACDGRKEAGGCKCGITDFQQSSGLNRFRCEQCDYDLCQKCFDGLPDPSVALSSAEHKYWTCPMCDEINRAERPHCNNCGLLVRCSSTDSAVSLPRGTLVQATTEFAPSAPPLAGPGAGANWSEGSALPNGPPTSSSSSSGHVPLTRLFRVNSEALLEKWLDKNRGIRAALPEYEVAAQGICVASELMSSSKLWKHLKYLKSQKAVMAPYEELITDIIHKAYKTRFRWVARYKTASVSGLGSGNLLEGAMHFFQALQWERPYLVQALDLLYKMEDADGLQVILGLMLSGSGWCHARKTFVFNTIVSRVRVPAAASEETRAGESPGLQVARQAVMEVVTEFIEDTKDQALKTTFLEPTKMHFRAKDEPVRENQVDVHGSNTYLAILSATLGVQLNRRPYLSDYSIGCVDFLADGAAPPPAWSESHFGRDWEGVRELRAEEGLFGEEGPKPLRAPGIFDRIEFFADTCLLQTRTGFVFQGGTAREVANAAVNPNGRREQRLHLARYLEKFASWFSEDFILPRMISRIIGDTGRVEALQVFMDDLITLAPHLAGDEGEEDVRFWLWDMSELPAKFRTDRAAHLMRHIGVLRAAASEVPALTNGRDEEHCRRDLQWTRGLIEGPGDAALIE